MLYSTRYMLCNMHHALCVTTVYLYCTLWIIPVVSLAFDVDCSLQSTSYAATLSSVNLNFYDLILLNSHYLA